MKALVVVESPTKVKTLSKFLGSDYVIKATYGHVKDLPKSTMGVDVEKDFLPHFSVVKGKAKVIAEIKKASREADHVYIGSDPDREGEAIAFHVAEEIGNSDKVKRVLFHEITEKGVKAALKSPTDLNKDKYDAQKVRRILDRLVGYEISPLLWERVKYGLSAGRVQSVALRLVSEREDAINAFVKEEYWTVEGDFRLASGNTFGAKLERIDGAKVKIATGDEADRLKAQIEGKTFVITGIEEKDRYTMPQPVFKTASLQQEASGKLRFSPKKTMLLAQKLYEGLDIARGRTTGLITYMRTDSVRVADEAVQDVRKLIEKQFGADYVPHRPNVFKNSKSAQDAHEGIRPTDVTLTPEKVKAHLDKDLYNLYEMIWKRFVASQMAREKRLIRTVEIKGNGFVFVARGSLVLFDGFTKVYERAERGEEEGQMDLPPMKEGETAELLKVQGNQHFTMPPAYYTEASLIKTLEANGVGRPSTYASTVGTIEDRGYVKKDKGRLMMTPLGKTVNTMVTGFFPRVIDVDFTALMEEHLDRIEDAQEGWVESLREFYAIFQKELSSAKQKMINLKKEEKVTDILCDKCGKPMLLRWGKNGEYLVCSGRPQCKNKKNAQLDAQGNVEIKQEESKGQCPNCGGDLVERMGRFGRFIACSTYPACKYTRPYTLGFPCPNPDCTGELVEKVSKKKKKKFYGCSKFPECTFVTGLPPKEGVCPNCGARVLFSYRNKNVCVRKDCGWKSA